jgi:hypothetical protein
MKISKPVKILIGILTFIAVLFPIFIMPTFMIFLMYSFGFPLFNPQSVPNLNNIEATLPFMLVFYFLMTCSSFTQLGLQIFYVVHEIKNKALNDTFRILFTLGIFMLPYIAMPIYYFAYLWKDRTQDSQVVQA